MLRIQSAEGVSGRTIVARLLPGTDMLEGIEAVCRKHGVVYAVVNCAIGAFRQAAFVYPIPDQQATVGIVYSQPVILEGPIEFLGGQGIVCQSEQGEYLLHFHGSASDKDMRVWGGHFIHGNIILATLDVVITEIHDVAMLRKFDEETGFIQLNLEQAEG